MTTEADRESLVDLDLSADRGSQSVGVRAGREGIEDQLLKAPDLSAERHKCKRPAEAVLTSYFMFATARRARRS